MPIAHFHLVDGVWSDEQIANLLERASQTYSTVLESPIERVRTFVVRYRPSDVATAGVRVPDGGAPAPYFTALVLRGRPEHQRHELLSALTDVVVEELGCERSLVRGQIIQIDPEDWGIGGRPASQARSAEIAARADNEPSGPTS
ncbi:tautomerase family protein [Ornithinimicrobium cryptoxanthini]|uniref:Tautomerase family protein n=1 Tax=Ornithinimicrobium cryptoxanthini TaxID=2934161 RepID=A0ABY4YGW4_9MICO|nr:tautomerase family protein [Ornithinimicrobium cryptoxanthini]USQ75997.1 tautomerase family protein [Ornithinimicrobium cryptoxanthini]